MKTLYALFVLLFAFQVIGAEPGYKRNVISTNDPTVVTFGGIAQVNDTVLGWDTVDNKFVDMFIGANLTYTHATHTLSGSAGGSGVSVESLVSGLLTTNGGNTLVTITPNGNGFTNLNGTNVVGNVTKALFVNDISTNSLPGTNLVGTYIGAGLTMNTARILGRTTAGVGAVEELSAGSGVTISGGQISATGSQTPWLQTEDAAGFWLTNLFYLQMSNIFGARGTYLTPSNAVIASSAFTNENLGSGSVIIGGPTILGGSNQISSSATAALIVARVSISNGVNRITGAGANVLVGSVYTIAGTNEILSATGPSVLIAGNRNGLNQVNSIGGLLLGNVISGTNILAAQSSMLIGEMSSSGLNRQLAPGSLLIGKNTTGTNEATASASGSLLVGRVENAGWNIGSGNPFYLFALADKGTNRASGAGSFLVGSSTDTNTITASGSPSFIFAHANRDFGSAAVTATNTFFIGAGDTNSTEHSFMVSYGQSNKLHVTKNGVGIGTNASGDVLKVNGATTHIGSVTNLDLLASQFMATDANKREVSTLNGAGLTNITTTATNLYFPLLIETNAGAVMFLDLPVSSAATAGTEQSYTFNVAGTAMLKLQRTHSSAGATTNAVIKTMAGFATNSITDFVIGTRYTNTSQRAWVSASVQLTAAVAGTAIVTLYCEQFQSVTNKVTVSAGPLASLITVEPLTMITSPQAVFYFLDEKTGAGASVGVVAGTCSRIEL